MLIFFPLYSLFFKIGLLCSPCCPGTHSADQAGLRDPSAFNSVLATESNASNKINTCSTTYIPRPYYKSGIISLMFLTVFHNLYLSKWLEMAIKYSTPWMRHLFNQYHSN